MIFQMLNLRKNLYLRSNLFPNRFIYLLIYLLMPEPDR